MKILIIYSTTEGQTRKISRYMTEVLKGKGHQVTLCDVTDDPPNPIDFDYVFVGASIHMGKYQKPIKYFIKENLDALNNIKSIFFSVCLAVASDLPEEHEEAEETLSHFIRGLGWKPNNIFHVAGALKYTQYNWLIKLVLKNIAKKQGDSTDTSRDHEYTNWEQLKSDTLDSISE